MPNTQSVVRPSRETFGRPTPYSIADRSAAAEAALAGAAPSLTPQAVAAMTDPDGVTALLEAAIELESNRLQRTTTVTLRDGSGTAVAVLDAGMTLSSLVSGRDNPTARYAVADFAIADEAVAFDADALLGDEAPVAFAGDVRPITANHSGVVGSPFASWTSQAKGYVGPGAGSSPSALASVGDALSPAPSRTAWQASAAQVATTRQLAPDATATFPTTYLVPAGTSRTFTVIGYATSLATAGTDLSLAGHFRVSYKIGAAYTTVVDGVNNFSFGGGGAGAAYTRNVYAFTVTNGTGADQIITDVRVAVEIDTNSVLGGTLTWARIAAAHVYSGADRGDLAGLASGVYVNAAGVAGAAVELTWPEPRGVNRVEASGDRRLSRLTSVRLEKSLDGTTWTAAGRAETTGRPVIFTDADYLLRGVRLTIEESTGADPYAAAQGRLYVGEVDPMLVRDVTDEVATCQLTWQREAKLGDGTLPFGNSQASSIALELQNTSGRYTPSANASLDTGHRIEAALGVRWSNLLGNPRGDVTAAGWTGCARTTVGISPAWPYGTALTATVTAAGVLTEQVATYVPPGSSIPTATGKRYRVSAWVDVRPGSGAAGVDVRGDLQLRNAVGAVVGTVAWLAPSTAYTGTGPRKVAGVVDVVTAGATRLEPRIAVRATSGTATLLFAVKVEELDLVTGRPVAYDELVPAGVFYSDPWDAPTGEPTVSITGLDRLGRFASTDVTLPVRQGSTVADLIREVALAYLDLDDDQVLIAASSGSYVIPYAYGTGSAGEYLADLAKATIATVYVDVLDRLALTPRAATVTTPVAELRADNALIAYRKPTGVDSTVATVTVSAAPLAPQPEAEVWSLPDGGITLAPSGVLQVVADFTGAPILTPYLTGVVASAGYTVATVLAADHALLTFTNPSAVAPVTISAAKVRGIPLAEQPLTVRRVDAPSMRRYGARSADVSARLVQTQAQLENIADALIDAFRGVNSAGVRRLPDVELDALGLVHLTVDDPVTVVDPATGAGADYQLTSRQVTYQDGSTLLLKATGREAPSAPFAVADVAIADDVYVAGY